MFQRHLTRDVGGRGYGKEVKQPLNGREICHAGLGLTGERKMAREQREAVVGKE